jgi:hypothetical protein
LNQKCFFLKKQHVNGLFERVASPLLYPWPKEAGADALLIRSAPGSPGQAVNPGRGESEETFKEIAKEENTHEAETRRK